MNAAELLRKLMEFKDWSVQELLWGGEALREGGAKFWEELFAQAARRGDAKETMQALLALERAWRGSTRHADLGKAIDQAQERLHDLEQSETFRDLKLRTKNY